MDSHDNVLSSYIFALKERIVCFSERLCSLYLKRCYCFANLVYYFFFCYFFISSVFLSLRSYVVMPYTLSPVSGLMSLSPCDISNFSLNLFFLCSLFILIKSCISDFSR